ncbi:hypothetical protein LTR70_004520 [Exophiala xenobiotica]|uniref:Uncharacterized protein n=1 Tax=Lithohypha guttulata TaxID=1690604 RepID=A0ABR0KNU1_9EURO|nr:hypothetical protein LTR24_000450 [Lithohypha guttulata]KAK5320437.1 hypothetical protein LTR70_004520 [Exophiala xenobiotica]
MADLNDADELDSQDAGAPQLPGDVSSLGTQLADITVEIDMPEEEAGDTCEAGGGSDRDSPSVLRRLVPAIPAPAHLAYPRYQHSFSSKDIF